MKLQAAFVISLSLTSYVSAHFSLYTPTAIGANVAGGPQEGTGPCGSFDITNRDSVVEWPVAGYPVYMITTHPKAVFEFRAALVNDTNTWIEIVPPINQLGVGFFCENSMPGFTPWIGLPVVLQVAQFAPDGINYQCAAIKFVAGGPAPMGECKNSTGVSADVAVGFTSTLPFGSVVTPTNTAAPSANPTGATTTSVNGNMSAATGGSTKPSQTTTSASAASTSKAASGAGPNYAEHSYSWLWTLSTAILSVWAL